MGKSDTISAQSIVDASLRALLHKALQGLVHNAQDFRGVLESWWMQSPFVVLLSVQGIAGKDMRKVEVAAENHSTSDMAIP